MTYKAKTRELIEAVLRGDSPQKNYRQAYELALAEVHKTPLAVLERLGVVSESAERLSVAVLGGSFHVDLAAGVVKDDSGQEARLAWGILVLHYLLSRPSEQLAEGFISFMDIPDARGYEKPYRGRVIERFLHTAGRDEAAFRVAAKRLDGKEIDQADAAYEFAVFPRVRVQLLWYRGDKEIDPGASFLYEKQIVGIFCVEDIVVMSELLVGALSAKH
ncbi:MAG: DUF3786 domain-containing protein [Phycisphaerae bacterium]|nr:DUF3786 domain-containing protein [Phycisphaerae bacterium]